MAAVYLLLDRLGDRRPLPELVAACPKGNAPELSLADLCVVLEHFGYDAAGYYVPPEKIGELAGPCIALMKGETSGVGHFVVLEPCADGVLYLEPTQSPLILAPKRAQHGWSGRVLMAAPREPIRMGKR